jgi:hypothetical protein
MDTIHVENFVTVNNNPKITMMTANGDKMAVTHIGYSKHFG